VRAPRFATGDQVTVRTKSGQGARGATFAPARTVPCRAEDSVRMVRDLNGVEVASQATLYLAATVLDETGAAVDALTAFAPQSLVTRAGVEVEVEVFTCQQHRVAGQPVYVEVALGRGGG
jgi:hypothetical protein